ncbi:MAG: hypothetical protein U0797_17825 [Gemmataceae bacterium]
MPPPALPGSLKRPLRHTPETRRSYQLRTLLVLAGTFGALAAAVAWQSGRLKGSPGRLPALPGQAAWFKGNLHTHSLWSDGDDFPEMIADWYKRHGYHFLALSDHNVLSEGERWLPITEKSTRPLALKKYRERFGRSWVEGREGMGKREVRLKPLSEFRSLLEEPGKFLLVPAEEITHAYAKRPVHMNGINLRDLVQPIDGPTASETISVNHRLVAEQAKKTRGRMLVVLNHPNFKWGLTAEDMIPAPELRFVEVFNGHPSVNNEGDENHPSCDQLWDIVLAQRLGRHGLGKVLGLATDDAHRYHKFGVGQVNPGRGWVMVKAPYLSAEAVVRAMDAGDFYASSGVTLDEVKVNHDELSLTIRPEPGVRYRTEFLATMKGASLDSTPRVRKETKPDEKEEKPKEKEERPAPLTRVYSADVGKVIAESSDLSPRYKLTGKEIYVRARVTSTKPHPNPYRKGDREMAWTQPAVPKAD